MQDVTDEFVESSRSVTENDDTYDLSDDHSKENPRLRRLKQPHLLHKTYENITLDDCILEPVSQLLGNNLRRDHTKLILNYLEVERQLNGIKIGLFILTPTMIL